MTTAADLLAIYDSQLRREAEFSSASDTCVEHGPLLWGVFRGTKGFVTYRDLGGLDARGIDTLVADTLAHYRALPEITSLEWKTRGHDDAPGLHTALVSRGFVREETESVMLGEAAALAEDRPLPQGVSLRQVTTDEDVRAMCACADEAFGEGVPGMADGLIARLAAGDDLELWVAEADDRMICTGRLEPVPGTEVAGLWGGATLERWRRRGVYRALTAARARSAVARGIRYLQSDSTEDSRPILERSGFVKVTETTPYVWTRP